MSESYNLIFFPTITQGTESEVADKLSATLKVDLSKVEEWFSFGKPTVLMKNVTHDVADRYMQAILNCGANCNIQPSGIASGLSLEPKPQATELFICPACQYDEDLPEGSTYEQCPKCGLVVDKWAAKKAADDEKEEIRRRLLRNARMKEENESDADHKANELERIRELERELMIELGIKPPSRFWMFFSNHPVSVASSVGLLLITISMAITFYVNRYIEIEEINTISEAVPAAEIIAVAPIMADAIELKKNGNETLVNELSDVTASMRGSRDEAQSLVKAAQQMMKGVDQEAFLKATMKAVAAKNITVGGAGQPPQSSVNLDTLGGVTGIQGRAELSAFDLDSMTPNYNEDGQAKLANLISNHQEMANPEDPSGPRIIASSIEKVDGSNLVNLLKNVSIDPEWDRYLMVKAIKALEFSRQTLALEIISHIKNPVIKVSALYKALENIVGKSSDADIQLNLARIDVELSRVKDSDVMAKLRLDVGDRLSLLGVVSEPFGSIERVDGMLKTTNSYFEKAVFASRLAVAYLNMSDRQNAHEQFSTAVRYASKITVVEDRISAFLKIAERYYDARNITLAGEILAEAQVLAATELEQVERSNIFGKIAYTQLYMGDLAGAILSIDNASVDIAKSKLLTKLAVTLIDENKAYLASALLKEVTDPSDSSRIVMRLAAEHIHLGECTEAGGMLEIAELNLLGIKNGSQRAIILGQVARLYFRLGDTDKGLSLMQAAFDQLLPVQGRQVDVVRGLLAVNQAKSLRIRDAKNSLELIEESFIREPISSEVVATDRIVRNLFSKIKSNN